LTACATQPPAPPLIVTKVEPATIPADLLARPVAPVPPAHHADGSNASQTEVDRYWLAVWQWGSACDARLGRIAPLVTVTPE